jgi:hypothetical protein
MRRNQVKLSMVPSHVLLIVCITGLACSIASRLFRCRPGMPTRQAPIKWFLAAARSVTSISVCVRASTQCCSVAVAGLATSATRINRQRHWGVLGSKRPMWQRVYPLKHGSKPSCARRSRQQPRKGTSQRLRWLLQEFTPAAGAVLRDGCDRGYCRLRVSVTGGRICQSMDALGQ